MPPQLTSASEKIHQQKKHKVQVLIYFSCSIAPGEPMRLVAQIRWFVNQKNDDADDVDDGDDDRDDAHGDNEEEDGDEEGDDNDNWEVGTGSDPTICKSEEGSFVCSPLLPAPVSLSWWGWW